MIKLGYVAGIASLLFLGSILLFSCSKPSVDKQLDKAEQAWQLRPDSLAWWLAQIDPPHRLSAAQRASYAQLFAKNEWLNNSNPSFKADSLLREAEHYYQLENDSLQLFYALYWQSLLHRKRDNYTKALAGYDAAKCYIPADSIHLRDQLDLITGYDLLQMGHLQEALALFKYLSMNASEADRWLYWLAEGRAFQALQNAPDSVTFYYNKAISGLQTSDTKMHRLPALQTELAGLYANSKQYEKALATAHEAKKTRASRDDIPKHNLVLGQLFLKTQQLDSAHYYLKLAAQGSDPYISYAAYQRLAELERQRLHAQSAFDFYQKQEDVYKELIDRLNVNEHQMRYQEKLLRLENEQLIMIKQRHELYIWLISLVAILLLWTAIWIYRIQRKRARQRAQQHEKLLLREKAIRLENENLLLKQENELNRLREKDALLRESLFRRMTLSQKIPSLATSTDSEPISGRHIQLTEADCAELIRTVDEAYDDFVQRLQNAFPVLGQKELIFCCLIKMKINMNDLSDIYCVSKAAITKKKQRLKNEKFNLASSPFSLDQFLDDF